MKYKAIYSVLEKRGREVPGFRYDDRSCWRLARLTYIDRLHSLWIIAVDPATGERFGSPMTAVMIFVSALEIWMNR